MGAGISKEVAIKLEMANVSAINIAGAGGTRWAGVEKLRAESLRDDLKKHLGEMFWDWGIPTASSLLEVRHTVKFPLDHIRSATNGLEIAKCVALGASISPQWHIHSFKASFAVTRESLFAFADTILAELKSTMFLVGAKDMAGLAHSRYILTGMLAHRG